MKWFLMFIYALTIPPVFNSHYCTIGAQGLHRLPDLASGATKLAGPLM